MWQTYTTPVYLLNCNSKTIIIGALFRRGTQLFYCVTELNSCRSKNRDIFSYYVNLLRRCLKHLMHSFRHSGVRKHLMHSFNPRMHCKKKCTTHVHLLQGIGDFGHSSGEKRKPKAENTRNSVCIIKSVFFCVSL